MQGKVTIGVTVPLNRSAYSVNAVLFMDDVFSSLSRMGIRILYADAHFYSTLKA